MHVPLFDRFWVLNFLLLIVKVWTNSGKFLPNSKLIGKKNFYFFIFIFIFFIDPSLDDQLQKILFMTIKFFFKALILKSFKLSWPLLILSKIIKVHLFTRLHPKKKRKATSQIMTMILPNKVKSYKRLISNQYYGNHAFLM